MIILYVLLVGPFVWSWALMTYDFVTWVLKRCPLPPPAYRVKDPFWNG